MAQQTRLPTGDSVDGLFLRFDTGTNTDLYSQIDEDPADDADYIYRGGGTTGGSFAFSVFTVPAGATINFVRITGRAQRTAAGANSAAGRLVVGGTNYTATALALTTSWANYDFDWTTNPATAAAWTVDQVNTIGANKLEELGWSLTGVGGAEESRLSNLRIIVDYTEAAGGSIVPIIMSKFRRRRN